MVKPNYSYTSFPRCDSNSTQVNWPCACPQGVGSRVPYRQQTPGCLSLFNIFGYNLEYLMYTLSFFRLLILLKIMQTLKGVVSWLNCLGKKKKICTCSVQRNLLLIHGWLNTQIRKPWRMTDLQSVFTLTIKILEKKRPYSFHIHLTRQFAG